MSPPSAIFAKPNDVPDARTQLLDEALAEGIAHHQAGDLRAAAALYGAVLQVDPEHAQALHLGGVVAFQQGGVDLARTLVERALKSWPRFPEAHNTLAIVLQATGDDAAAQAHLETAVALAPKYADALKNLGALNARRGNMSEAIGLYERALACGSRGADLLAMLGIALEADDRAREALCVLDQALELSPEHGPALIARASAQRCLGWYEDACSTFERALARTPESIEAWIGLGTTRLDQMRTDDAIACFDRGLQVAPDHAQLRFNRSMACLTGGRIAEGWRDHGWRWNTPGFDSEQRKFAAPRWDGATSLANRTVLLWREQGIADQMVFASLLDDVRALVGHCIYECEPRLAPLMRRSFPGIEVVAASEPSHPRTAAAEIDFHAPLVDLAPLLRPTLESFAGKGAHLRADPDRRAYWRNKLDALGPRPKVGISWRSSNIRGVRALSCTVLPQWRDLLRRAPVDWINLQYDRCDEELAASYAATGVPIHRFPELDMMNALDDTAALMSALDLVVTAPTAVSAMSGSLGVPTWHLASGAEWSALGTPHTPWLPAVRRFYRPWQQDWTSVLATIGDELSSWLDSRITAG